MYVLYLLVIHRELYFTSMQLYLSLSLSLSHTHTLKFSLVIQTKLYSIFMNLSLSHTHTHSLSLSLSRPRARALSLSCLITGEICSYALLHASLRPLQLGADAYGWNRKPQAQVQVPYIYLCVCVCKQEEDTRALSPSLPSTCEHARALFHSHTFNSSTLYGYLG